MREWVNVVESNQGNVTLCQLKPKKSYCKNCSGTEGCRKILSGLESRKSLEIKILSQEKLLPGQKIELSIREGALLKAVVVTYMIPILCFLASAFVLQSILNQEYITILGAFFGGAIGYLLAKWIMVFSREKLDLEPIIINSSTPASMSQDNREFAPD